MREFKVNKYITLKLEGENTNIYVKGKLFNQCKYVLTIKKVYELEDLLTIESIDQLAENLDNSLEGIESERIDIPPDIQFWVHCSNLQVWTENNYDTRLLHSNLAFPLLKKLKQLGDPLAKKVFSEEVLERYNSGSELTKSVIENERLLDSLDLEQKKMLFKSDTEAEAYIELSKLIAKKIKIIPKRIQYLPVGIRLSGGFVRQLSLQKCGLKTVPKSILKFSKLKGLNLSHNDIEIIPNWVGDLICLEYLSLVGCRITILPVSLKNLSNLKSLLVPDNEIETLPDFFDSLSKIRNLSIRNNKIKVLPDSLQNSTSRIILDIDYLE